MVVDSFLVNIGLFAFINNAVVTPVIFNYFIIPSIEKKIGGTLQFTGPSYRQYLAKPMTKYFEVAIYIALKYLLLKLGLNADKYKIGSKFFALQKINYDVRCCSAFEIIVSILALISVVLFVSIGGYFYYQEHGNLDGFFGFRRAH